MGRLFWKFFFFFWLAQLLTSIGVGIAIWAMRPGDPPPQRAYIERSDELPPRQQEHRHGFLPPPLPIIAGSSVSLVFAALLAWYFSQPIRSLRSAFQAVANGRLATRVEMDGRRDELADLGDEFDRMATRLESLVEGQLHLLHDVSHELRSPLARVQAAIDLIEQQPERAQDFVARIRRDSDRMDRLVGELLTLARLDAGGSMPPKVDLDLVELLEEIVEDARIEAGRQNCRIELRRPLSLHLEANPELLRRAVENVLRNALRHSPDAGLVEVSLKPERAGCEIMIADRGPGVPDGALQSMFQPFQRLGQARAFEGYGLGLAITRRVMDCHGGLVRASNRSGGGLCVMLYLPSEHPLQAETLA